MTARLLLMATLAALAQPLTAQTTPAVVEVSGAVKQTLALSAADLAKMPRAAVKATHHGVETAFEGVWLDEVLKRAGVPQGEALRGKALAGYVLASARDGYQVVFSIAELDPSFVESRVLLADTGNGKPLAGEQGPFQLVATRDKPGARSIRMVTRLEVVQLRK